MEVRFIDGVGKESYLVERKSVSLINPVFAFMNLIFLVADILSSFPYNLKYAHVSWQMSIIEQLSHAWYILGD